MGRKSIQSSPQNTGFVNNNERNDCSREPPLNVVTIKEEPNFQEQQEINIETEEKIYTVENVINRRKIGSKVYYLIKWKGFSSKRNTWEPKENVEQLDLVKFYEEARNNAPKEIRTGRKNLKRSYFDAVGQIWAVEKVVKKRFKKEEIEYLLKWEGVDEVYNSWEPRKMVKHLKVVKAYEKEAVKANELKRRFPQKSVKQEYNIDDEISAPKTIVRPPKLIEDRASRQYYDCVTFTPIADISSVRSKSPWAKNMWQKKMDDNRELNASQKHFAMMWNEFLLANRLRFRGKCHMKTALDEFVKENGERLLEVNLRSHYITHISIMRDLGILKNNEAMDYIMLLNSIK